MPSPLSLRPYSDQKSGPLPIFNGSRRRRNSDSLTTAGSSRKSRDSWLPSLRILSPSYHGRKRGPCLTLILYLLVIVCVCAFGRRYMSRQRTWPVIGPSSTLVFKRKDLQNIWLWEIASGHHPSRRKVPTDLAPLTNIANPAHPAAWKNLSPAALENNTAPGRKYFEVQHRGLDDTSYPPRPLEGSAADLDIIMEHCDFSKDKFVRDCLEVMRIGGGLDNGRRVRRESEPYRYIFTQEDSQEPIPILPQVPIEELPPPRSAVFQNERDADAMDGSFRRAPHAEWEPPLKLSDPHVPTTTCDPDEPRIFHMYWTGPFTDKPNLTLLSFLFTQNLGLSQPPGSDDDAVPPCRPKLWLWVDPGPTSIITDHELAYRKLVAELKSNKWSAPFLHPRFKDVIEIKLWNLFDQLDSVAELKDDWRHSKALLNSGGHNINVPQKKKAGASSSSVAKAEGTGTAEEEGAVEIPAEMKEKLSTVLSDLVRFILVHRFGGVYLDTDTVFLRDWEELWNWRGAFAYRWSWHDKYNTAVLRMHKGSALGTFILRTALKNNLDFHPMSISDYLKDARLDDLLYRLPDALFDSAWLNMEGYQRERPPQPYFRSFEEFFNTPSVDSAAPQALGFDGFFKGAFSYHFHNTWWRPVDVSHSCPDLGARFTQPTDNSTICGTSDQRDLDWSTVLKRTFEAFLREERPNMYGEWIKY